MAQRQSRNVSLTPELEAYITRAMKTGDYANASEVVRAGLRALRDGAARRPALKGWPFGGGDCGALIRETDWSRTVLGPIDGWSLELRATVSNIVNSPVAKVLMWGPDHIMLYNDAYSVIAGTNHPRAIGGKVAELFPEVWDWNRPILEAGFRGELSRFNDQTITLAPGGRPQTYVFDLFYTPVHEADGSVGGVMCTLVDNSARMRAAQRFRTAIDAVHGVLWTNSADGRMSGEQPGWAALTGQSEAEYRDYGWADAVHPDDRAESVRTWNEAVAAKTTYLHEHRVRAKSGVWRTFAIRSVPILDEDGRLDEWVGVHTDITHQRAAEASLRAQAETLARQVRHRERAEEQLRQLNDTLEARVIAEIDERRLTEAKLAQSQKMETVGKLTGGVAHDFNNLLQVVSGNLQLLAKDVAGNERAEQRVVNALAGVSRGAKLASQLLAFGRRQALEPKVVNVTRFIAGMDDMIRRAIGGAVEVETVFTGGLWNTFIDPVQIENAILNLAINARDAMEGEGKLTIELANAHLDDGYARSHDDVAPGQYVMLAVSDTGSGMAPEIVERVFEPFFTTKAEGKGSGLGLSMVYGFVKQSGGHVKIYSEVGHGTTIKLYLPRAMEAEDVEIAVDTGPIAGGTETILVVEDDAEVRATVVELLSDLGYRVLKAVDATSALSVVESGIPIDILFTDVVMPGPLKSPELARKARERLPDIAVLFTSGYTENSIVHGGRLDAGLEFLPKPYSREALAQKLRHVLANGRQRQSARSPCPAPPSATAITTPQTTRTTVLLVEDDPLIRTTTAEMLKDEGYVVVEAESAEDAMAALQTAPVSILVTDVNLPGLSGTELARRARAVRPEIAVIYATGDSSGVAEGTNVTVLVKPYDVEGLVAAIGRADAGSSAKDAADTPACPVEDA